MREIRECLFRIRLEAPVYSLDLPDQVQLIKQWVLVLVVHSDKPLNKRSSFVWVQARCEYFSKKRDRPFASITEQPCHLFFNNQLEWLNQKHDLGFSSLKKDLINLNDDFFNFAVDQVVVKIQALSVLEKNIFNCCQEVMLADHVDRGCEDSLSGIYHFLL